MFLIMHYTEDYISLYYTFTDDHMIENRQAFPHFISQAWIGENSRNNKHTMNLKKNGAWKNK